MTMSDVATITPWAFGALVRKLRYKQYRFGGFKGLLNFALTALLTLGMVTFGVLAVVAARYDRDGAAMVAAGLAVTLVAWTILPITFAAGNAVVDPQLYAMYPIPRSTLGTGLLSAAFISMPAFGAVIVGAATLTHAPSLLGGIVIGFAAIVGVVTAVLSSQTVMVYFSGAIQRRSTKDFAAAFGALIAITVAMVPQAVLNTFEDGGDFSQVRRFVGVVNTFMVWVPWGWAPLTFRAGADGQWGQAVLFGALALGWVAALFWLWSRALARSLVERPAKSGTGEASVLVSSFQQRLWGSAVAAAVARSGRELYRDARQLTELAGWLPLLVIAAVPGWDAIRSGADALVLSSSLVGVAIGTTALNLFGFDGPAFGLDVLVDHDLGYSLRGKLIARLQLGAVIVTVVAVALAAVTGGWRFVPASIVFAMTGLLVELAIGAIVSVRYPFPVPPKAGTESMFYNPGCVNQVVRFVALLAAFVLVAPIVGPATLVSIERSVVWGFALASIGLLVAVFVYRFCVLWSERRLRAVAPDMFQVLSEVG